MIVNQRSSYASSSYPLCKIVCTTQQHAHQTGKCLSKVQVQKTRTRRDEPSCTPTPTHTCRSILNKLGFKDIPERPTQQPNGNAETDPEGSSNGHADAGTVGHGVHGVGGLMRQLSMKDGKCSQQHLNPPLHGGCSLSCCPSCVKMVVTRRFSIAYG